MPDFEGGFCRLSFCQEVIPRTTPARWSSITGQHGDLPSRIFGDVDNGLSPMLCGTVAGIVLGPSRCRRDSPPVRDATATPFRPYRLPCRVGGEAWRRCARICCAAACDTHVSLPLCPRARNPRIVATLFRIINSPDGGVRTLAQQASSRVQCLVTTFTSGRRRIGLFVPQS